MANEKPGGWNIGYITEEVRKELEKKEKKIKEFDNIYKGEFQRNNQQINNILDIYNKK